jgi:hypothetical protein
MAQGETDERGLMNDPPEHVVVRKRRGTVSGWGVGLLGGLGGGFLLDDLDDDVAFFGGHVPGGEPFFVGLFEAEDFEAFGEVGHVGGAIEDADVLFAGGDGLFEGVDGGFVAFGDEDGSGGAFDVGDFGFDVLELAAEDEFEVAGTIGAGEHHEQFSEGGFFGLVGLRFGHFLEHDAEHEGEHAFAAFFLEAGEGLGVEVGVDEVSGGVVDGVELEIEVENVLEEALEHGEDGVGAVGWGGDGHAAGLDHLVEEGIVRGEGFVEVGVVFFVGDVDSGDEVDGDAVGVFVGGDGGFEAAAAIVVVDEAEVLVLFGGLGGGRLRASGRGNQEEA